MGIRISALPSIASPALSDIFPVVQDGVTYKETVTQLSTLIGGVVSGSIIGTANQIVVTPGVGNVTLSTPQDIAPTSDVTFGSLTFSPTTKGIVGTTSNNDAASGYVGEFISQNVLVAGAIGILNNTTTDLTSIDLTAGDWDVYANITWLFTGNSDFVAAWTSSSSATVPDFSLISYNIDGASGSKVSAIAPYKRFSLNTTTTIYITGLVQFSTGTCTMCGNIYARRVR